MTGKICNVCGVEKPLTRENFGSANGGKGWQPHCRSCGKIRSALHRHEKAAELAAYDKDRRARDQRPTFNREDKVAFWRRQNGICLCCAKPILIKDVEVASVDHRMPLVKGGNNNTETLALVHRPCNDSKHNKTLEEHWAWRFNQKLDLRPLDYQELSKIIAQASPFKAPH